MHIKKLAPLATSFLLCSCLHAFEIINVTNTTFKRIQITTKNNQVLYLGPLDNKKYLPVSTTHLKAITKDLPLTLTLHEGKKATNLLIDHTPATGDIVEFSDRWMIYRDKNQKIHIMEINRQARR